MRSSVRFPEMIEWVVIPVFSCRWRTTPFLLQLLRRLVQVGLRELVVDADEDVS
jgi:hypothetical protein